MARGDTTMLRSLKSFEGYRVSATDGEIGSVVNFLFDDARWAVRYLVVETGTFFEERRVLLSPISFRQVDGTSRHFHVALTKDKVKGSPSVDVDKPVSRQHERDYYQYYGYPYYWGYPGLWGLGLYPNLLATGTWKETASERPDTASQDLHLRSAKDIRGYHIQGNDDEIGHVADFIVDDETWEVRYLVIDTSNWWMGKKVLVAPHWASRISWEESKVHVALSRETIKNSPEWNPDAPVNRAYEERLYDYYGRPVYWTDAPAAPTATPSKAYQVY
jgi:uncharacterized protein YrrD